MSSLPASIETNSATIRERALEAASLGAQLVVFPECALTGYALTTQEIDRIAEPIPGPSTTELQRICQQTGITLLVGGIERDPVNGFFNSAALIGPEGLICKYRKTHLPYLGADRYLAAGDRLLEPIDTHLGVIGMLICYDFRFPEPIRILALKGAQIVLLPTAWPASATLYPEFMARTRAAENRVFVLAANHVGKERELEFLGRSLIAAPDGTILAEASANEEEIMLVEVDPTMSDRKRLVDHPGEYELDLFQDRRPELYRGISEDPNQ
jgi:predicted amidohydrolase